MIPNSFRQELDEQIAAMKPEKPLILYKCVLRKILVPTEPLLERLNFDHSLLSKRLLGSACFSDEKDIINDFQIVLDVRIKKKKKKKITPRAEISLRMIQESRVFLHGLTSPTSPNSTSSII